MSPGKKVGAISVAGQPKPQSWVPRHLHHDGCLDPPGCANLDQSAPLPPARPRGRQEGLAFWAVACGRQGQRTEKGRGGLLYSLAMIPQSPVPVHCRRLPANVVSSVLSVDENVAFAAAVRFPSTTPIAFRGTSRHQAESMTQTISLDFSRVFRLL